MNERPPLIEAQRLVSGFRGYQLVVAACRLKLPDLVVDAPRSAAELAVQTNTHPKSLHRMLRGLAVWGFFLEGDDGRYAATPVSDLFREDKPGLRNNALMLAEEGYQSWAEMMYTLRSGRPAFEHIFGKSRWDKLAEDPDALEQFNAAMVETSARIASGLLASYDFGGVQSVVDVGGGNGGLLAGVLLAHPEMKGVLFDLPQGLLGALQKLDAAGLAGRVVIEEGSFFDAVPSGADLYMLKSIVHDWDDERAVEILTTCRKAMGPQAKLLLVERHLPELIDDPDVALSTVMTDLHMMIVLGGAERTAGEYRQLMEEAALHVTGVIPIGADFCVVEAVVAQV